jgi:RNA-directed DNA polymerase
VLRLIRAILKAGSCGIRARRGWCMCNVDSSFWVSQARKAASAAAGRIVTGAKSGGLYAYPRGKSIQRFKDRVRQRTRRGVPLKTKDLIERLNPLLRGWGHYYKRAHVRTLFHKLDHWIERRIWSHRYKCWRNCGWKQLPKRKLYGEYGLVHLVKLIPSIAAQQHAPS